jgi:ATP-binding cassette subfamily B protein
MMQSSTIQSSKVYRWLFSFLLPYKSTLILFVLTSFFLSAVELSVPKFIEYFTDHIVPEKNWSALWLMLGIIGVIFVLSIAVTGWKNNLQRTLQEKPSMDMLQAEFIQLRKLGFSYYEQNPSGEIISLFQDEIQRLQTFYQRYLPGILHQGSMLIISASLMIRTSVQLSLIVIPCFLSYYLIGPFFEKRAALWAKEAQARRTTANRHLFNSFSALWELRAYGAAGWDIGKLLTSFRQLHQADNTQNWNAYLRGTVRRVTTGIGAFAIFAYGAHLIQQDKLSIGAFCAVALLYFYVINNLTFLVTLMTEQKIIITQAEKLFSFAHTEPAVKEAASPYSAEQPKGSIIFRNVQFAYPESGNILQGFNLDISPGQKIGLVGTSGNGKSTIIKLLGRFYDPTDGEILLDGIPLKKWEIGCLRESIGFVFQETYLFGTTIRENIRFGKPDATDEEVVQAAQSACAHDFIMELPQGYDSPVGERGIKLSGGQRQRIAIARMFVKQPSIIFLDEATSALDNASESAVQQALRALTDNRTTIAVAHRLSTVRDYDRIVVIEEGRSVESGTYDELVANRGSFYRLLAGDEEKSRGGIAEA